MASYWAGHGGLRDENVLVQKANSSLQLEVQVLM